MICITTCKWCGKQTNDLEYCPNWGECANSFYKYETRKIIAEFAKVMEEKMQEKDKKGYTHKDKSLKFLVDKLNEERIEADFELKDLPSFEVDEELLHEAIMTMLVRYKIKNLTKGDLK